jgi:methyltransferase (TIGR00027 family)
MGTALYTARAPPPRFSVGDHLLYAAAMRRSLIAGANAWFRAAESELPPGRRILHDGFARHLAEHDPRVELVRLGRFLVPPLWLTVDALRTVHCVRHRTIDELVLAAVDEGFRQVVVVGAGYDMRRSRFADRLDGVRWVEMDQPAMIERKRRLIEGVPGVARDVDAVPIDLEARSLGEALGGIHLDRAAPTCFVVEGVIHYLPRSRVDDLLRSIAAHGPSRSILSFIRSDVYERAGAGLIGLVSGLGEIPRLHFPTEELHDLLAQHGFGAVRSYALAEQIARFAPNAAGRRAGASQDVVVADHSGSRRPTTPAAPLTR